MAVSDETGGAEPIKPKRILRPLTKHQWTLLRIQYEQGGDEISYAKLAGEHGVSYSTLTKRAADEGWTKAQELVTKAGKMLAKATDDKLAEAVDEAAAKVSKSMLAELQPWIEKEKRHHIKRAIKRSKAAFKRLDRVAEGYQVYDAKREQLVNCETTPKDEMAIANAEEKYDSIIRRTLGMNEGSGIGGSLSVQVLTNQAAVSIKTEQSS